MNRFSFSCQRQELTPDELARLIEWAKTLKHRDFDTMPQARLLHEAERESVSERAVIPFGQIVFPGDLFLCDAEPGKLVLVRYTGKRRFWKGDKKSLPRKIEFVDYIVETKATYGDYVNGCWLLPQFLER